MSKSAGRKQTQKKTHGRNKQSKAYATKHTEQSIHKKKKEKEKKRKRKKEKKKHVQENVLNKTKQNS